MLRACWQPAHRPTETFTPTKARAARTSWANPEHRDLAFGVTAAVRVERRVATARAMRRDRHVRGQHAVRDRALREHDAQVDVRRVAVAVEAELARHFGADLETGAADGWAAMYAQAIGRRAECTCERRHAAF